MANAKKALIGLASGMLAGVIILGIGGRIVMRAIALLAHAEPEFSFAGTLEVMAFSALIGLPSGLIFVAIRKYIPGSGALKGAVFGMLVFLVVVFIPGDAKNAALAFPELFPLAIAMFAALFVAFGIVLSKY